MLVGASPRLYDLFPGAMGTIDTWSEHLPRIRAMDFDVLYVNPFHEVGPSGHPFAIKDPLSLAARYRPRSSNLDDAELIAGFVGEARQSGLRVMIDSVLTHTSSDAPLLTDHPDWFKRDALGREEPFDGPAGAETARLDWYGRNRDEIHQHFRAIVQHHASLGIEGFRCPAAWMVPVAVWTQLISEIKQSLPGCFFCADALGRPEAEIEQLRGAGFDFIFNSFQWWDEKSPWFLRQESILRSVAPTIGFPDSWATAWSNDADGAVPDPAKLARDHHRRYLLAACFSAGVMMPMGYERIAASAPPVAPSSRQKNADQWTDISTQIAAVNRLKASVPALGRGGPIRALARPFDAVQGFLRADSGRTDLVFILVNTDADHPYTIDLDWLLSALDQFVDFEDITPGAESVEILLPLLTLDPGDVRVLRAHPAIELSEPENPGAASLSSQGAPPSRLIIEAIEPVVDGGDFPIRVVVGDQLSIFADIFRDGHDAISAAIRLWDDGASSSTIAPMRFVDNDRWGGAIALKQAGRSRYTIEAWTDHFTSWRNDMRKKRAAGQPVASELWEGRDHVLRAIDRAASAGRDRIEARIKAILARFEALRAGDESGATALDLLLSHFVAHAMAAVPDKTDRATHTPAIELVVDRKQARFSSWYEMFPRSQGDSASKSGSFADCERRLPEIRSLGFDVLYLVPIHPIGRTNRKGRNNSLVATPGDPGSPYAIGNEGGGHTAIDPELGTLEEFRRFHAAVKAQGMELAMDVAVQCAPDHPWVSEHPTWFRRRPDGSIKFAENPPKKYEDIVNLDFDCPEWFDIWQALLDVVRFWVDEGVAIFRIDNPHTKPVAFWQWLIATVKQDNPRVLFLAEAFTRPKMMRRLAKAGFTQSYSYFTWRNTKAELTEYLEELTAGPSRLYMQPNFFTNTPDILPFFLQTGGRAGFRIRLVLAATLSPSYGIYNGFELCEDEAVPGHEEYANSEKYQYKVWDWDRPGNIKDDIRRLNRLRHESVALQEFSNLRFLEATHPNVLFYDKAGAGGRDLIFVAVNLDPKDSATTELKFPLETMGLGEDDVFETDELFSGERRQWRGRYHQIVLDPAVQPAMILRRVAMGDHAW